MVSRTPTEQLTAAHLGTSGVRSSAFPAAMRAPSAGTTVSSSETEEPFSNLAYWCLLGFIFVSTSRILDYTLPGLHLPLILAVLAAGFTFISRGVSGMLSTSVSKLMFLYALWFTASIPFSQWRGGSFGVFTNDLLKSLLLFAMVIITVNSGKRLRGAMVAITLGILTTMGIALFLDNRVNGRLTMSTGQFSNPNDLAQVMLVGMCFIPVISIGIGKQSRQNIFLQLGSYVAMLLFLYTVFETGSRSGLVTVAVLAVVTFLMVSMSQKLIWGVLCIGLGAGMLTISDTARARMATLFSPDPNTLTSRSEENALASTDSRLQSLRDSLQLTLQNPLFGVGPGVFQVAAAEIQGANGQRALWIETHNAYTQVSSETGIPGLIFYGGAVLICIKGLLRVRKQATRFKNLRQMRYLCTCLLIGFLSFAVTSLFSSVAYQFTFWLLIALCSTSIAFMDQELARQVEDTARAVSQQQIPARLALDMQARRAQGPTPPARTTRVTLSGRIRPVRQSSPQSRGA